MATRIRLRRVGRKKQPEFRIVVAEHTAARDGRFIETLGHYRPREKPAVIQVDADRARAWIAQGALPTETVRSLLKQAGVFAKPGASATTEPPGSPAAE
ncbi:MAG TPA: 30S ribosomal protein S16 [Gemmatimonadales bacterium]|nr:30S ribosomal protein S16 [Gemmatimonadales bacterium]